MFQALLAPLLSGARGGGGDGGGWRVQCMTLVARSTRHARLWRALAVLVTRDDNTPYPEVRQMRMNLTGRLLAAALLSVAAGCQGDETETDTLASQEARAEQCVQRFDGIQSCATGSARLTSTEKGLAVSGLRSAKTDGVASTFSKAVKWSQDTEVKLGAGGSLSFAARSGDQVVSTLSVTPGREPNTVQLAPRFTGAPGGSPYRMNVYNDGVLTGSSSEPAGLMITFYNWRDFISWLYMHADFFEIDIWYVKPGVTGLQTAPANVGACGWRLHTDNNPFTVKLSDGTEVTGDQVEFIEEIEDGHYPYNGFTGIDVKAAAEGFNIVGESVTHPAK